jgi:hypothetical protein
VIRSSLFLALAEKQTPNVEPVAERYDEDRDELLVERDGQWIPAATHPDGPPRTKKYDIERGEDMKGW